MICTRVGEKCFQGEIWPYVSLLSRWASIAFAEVGEGVQASVAACVCFSTDSESHGNLAPKVKTAVLTPFFKSGDSPAESRGRRVAVSDALVFVLTMRSGMELSAADYAKLAKVDVRVAQSLAASGQVRARKVSGVWLFQPPNGQAGFPLGRPLSERAAEDLRQVLRQSGGLQQMDSRQRFRALTYVKRLQASDNPARLLRGWYRNFEPPGVYGARRGVVADLLADGRVFVTGASFPTFKLTASYPKQIYVREGDRVSIELKYDLRVAGVQPPAPRGDVVTVWIQQSRERLPRTLLLGTAVIDLARHSGREIEETVRAQIRPWCASILGTGSY